MKGLVKLQMPAVLCLRQKCQTAAESHSPHLPLPQTKEQPESSHGRLQNLGRDPELTGLEDWSRAVAWPLPSIARQQNCPCPRPRGLQEVTEKMGERSAEVPGEQGRLEVTETQAGM